MSFKVVNNSDAGTLSLHGGNDVDRYSQLLNGVNVGIPDINSSFRFRSGKLEIRNPGNSFSYSMVGAALAANRILTLPLLTTDDTLVTLNFAQTLTNKTIDASVNTITNIAKSSIPAATAFEDEANVFTAAQSFGQGFDIGDAKDIALGTTTGTKIGTATTQKLGFFNKTPIAQKAANANTSGAALAALETEVNEIKQLLRDYGLMA